MIDQLIGLWWTHPDFPFRPFFVCLNFQGQDHQLTKQGLTPHAAEHEMLEFPPSPIASLDQLLDH